MTAHFADRLLEAIRGKDAPVCVGLDPLLARLPDEILSEAGLSSSMLTDAAARVDPDAAGDALLTFGRGVVDAVAGHVAALKINIAFFEPYHDRGIRAYFELVRYARQRGLIVIGDVKRADIGHSSTQYAIGQLSNRLTIDDAMPDAITVNPYFGADGVRPFVEIARAAGAGVFVLVQTSNESAAQVQGLSLTAGGSVCEHIARLVQAWAGDADLSGRSGYSCVGAVVSPRDVESTKRIREIMPSCIFLVPGFGAQGRTAGEVRHCFKEDGTGAIVNASRSVIFAHDRPDYRDRRDDWRGCVEAACQAFVDEIRAVVSG